MIKSLIVASNWLNVLYGNSMNYEYLPIAYMKGKLLDLILDNQTYTVHKQEHYSELVIT